MSRSSGRSYFAVLLVIVTCGFLGVGFSQRSFQAPAADTDVRSNLKQFSEIYDLVEQNYAEPVSADKAIYNGAIPGMLHSLDPHSNFFDPKSYSLLREEQRGKYYGVGMTVGPRNHDDLVVARADRHAHAVVFAALLFPQQGIGLRIKEVRVRIQRMQHSRDRAVINGLVGAHRLGVVFFHRFINLGELLVAVPNVGIAAGRGCGADPLREDYP